MKSDQTAIAFGLVLRALREERSLTQEELAFNAAKMPNIHISRAHVSQLERGERSPTLKTILVLSSALKIPLSELILIFEEKLKETQG